MTYGFKVIGKPTIPGRVIGEDSSQSKVQQVEEKPNNIQLSLRGITDAAFEVKRQLVYYKDLELYLTAQLQAVKQKIKETEEELNNGNQQ